ncbi:phytanoyl-CoA dioxygenase family protein [Hydrogenophaga sp.]|jgi:ectoine hydroxylase|uniref:phytanoyl-CoA dioxygenase family protein n=1 Tax=Hydrogenophaga sp. TaxID=1904254 RepID=UPI003F7116C0
MKESDVTAFACKVLSSEQRRSFFEQGYAILPAYVPPAWLKRLRTAMIELIEESRHVTRSDGTFVLDANHSAEHPRLHRIANPQARHPAFWEFFNDPLMTDLAADVVGPDVKFHHAKLNVKSEKGSGGFKWHQDIPAWPHTDFSPVTIGIYLEDCGLEQGPLAFIPGSNRGALHPMYDEKGTFTGIDTNALDGPPPSSVVLAAGVAGSTVLVNCRVVHGSAANESDHPRPLLLPVYSSADSFPYTPNPVPNEQCGEIVRGEAAKFASFDTSPCILPPDFRRTSSAPWAVKLERNVPGSIQAM